MSAPQKFYSYGSYMMLPEKHLYSGSDGQILQQLGLPRPAGTSVTDRALEKAAKYICNLRCGMCPIREQDFKGCSVECHPEIRPWQCWVDHLKHQAAGTPVNND